MSTLPFHTDAASKWKDHELASYTRLVCRDPDESGIEFYHQCDRCGLKGRPNKFRKYGRQTRVCPRCCESEGVQTRAKSLPIVKMNTPLTDVRPQTLKLLRFLKDAIPPNEATLFTKEFLAATSRLFGFDLFLVEELIAHGVLKKTEPETGGQPGTMLLHWIAKGSCDEAFDMLVVGRRRLEDEREKSKLQRPATLADVHAIFQTRIRETGLTETLTEIARDIQSREKEIAQRQQLVASLESMRRQSLELATVVKSEAEKTATAATAIRGIQQSLEDLYKKVGNVESAVKAITSTPLGALGKDVEEFMDMVTNDLHGNSVHLKNVEDNVRMLMASFQQQYREAPVKNTALARKLAVGFVGPHERDWSHITSGLDANIIPTRIGFTGDQLAAKHGFDYVLIAKGCTPCLPQFRDIYGERAIVVPSNGVSRMVATANALV